MAALSLGCEAGRGSAADTATAVMVPGWESATRELPPPPSTGEYRPITVRNGGRIRIGTELPGEVLPSEVTTPQRRRQSCGPTYGTPAIAHTGGRLANVVVWLADIRTGKRLPLERRFVLTNVHCQLEPRVQAAIVGGTLNVRSIDSVPHATHLYRARTGSTLGVVRMADPGSVVPMERVLDRVGLIEVHCDTHPWTLGWIAVFDHPYFGVTSRDGGVTIDDVPSGRYTVNAWHERLGVRSREVDVIAGRETAIALQFTVPPATLR